VLFATDCPFDPEGGPMFIRETIAAIGAAGEVRRLTAIERGAGRLPGEFLAGSRVVL